MPWFILKLLRSTAGTPFPIVQGHPISGTIPYARILQWSWSNMQGGVQTIYICQLTSAGPSGLIHRPGSKDAAASKPLRPRRKLARDYHRALRIDESGITIDPIAAIKLNVAWEPANSCGNRAKDLSVSHC